MTALGYYTTLSFSYCQLLDLRSLKNSTAWRASATLDYPTKGSGESVRCQTLRESCQRAWWPQEVCTGPPASRAGARKGKVTPKLNSAIKPSANGILSSKTQSGRLEDVGGSLPHGVYLNLQDPISWGVFKPTTGAF